MWCGGVASLRDVGRELVPLAPHFASPMAGAEDARSLAVQRALRLVFLWMAMRSARIMEGAGGASLLAAIEQRVPVTRNSVQHMGAAGAAAILTA